MFQSLEGIFGFFNQMGGGASYLKSWFQSLEGIFGFFNLSLAVDNQFDNQLGFNP
ncbi:hypothetical protein CKA32_000675 [Geitlerinema sp. FC II]|nr:hypothetical protein CKA32_000675 [Geitlerinema sp. FC II]